MAFIPLPLGLRVAMEYTLDGQLVVNVYHVKASSPISTIYMEAILEAFQQWWEEDMALNFTSSIGLERIVVKDVSVEDGSQVEEEFATPLFGTVGSVAAVPNNVAICIGLKTAQTGRSFRGRNYYAGLLETDFALSLLSGGRVATLFDSALALPGRLNDLAEAELAIASYVHNGAPRTTGVLTPVTSMTINSIADSQRRRLPGRGA